VATQQTDEVHERPAQQSVSEEQVPLAVMHEEPVVPEVPVEPVVVVVVPEVPVPPLQMLASQTPVQQSELSEQALPSLMQAPQTGDVDSVVQRRPEQHMELSVQVALTWPQPEVPVEPVVVPAGWQEKFEQPRPAQQSVSIWQLADCAAQPVVPEVPLVLVVG
jgi:hypothetical protein